MSTVLHLSDTHIPNQHGDLRGTIDPFQKLDATLEYMIKQEINPAFTIITGDISDTGSTQSYKHIKKYISKLEAVGGPVFPTMGNCDNRQNFSKTLLGKTKLLEEPLCYYSRSIEGVHVIVLDSHTPGDDPGSLGENQLDWLKSELEEHIDMPSIIALHDPIYFGGDFGLFVKKDAQKFKEIISNGNVLAVLNGHLHCPLYGFRDGVNYVQAGSPVWLNYHNDRTGKVTRFDSSCFNLIG